MKQAFAIFIRQLYLLVSKPSRLVMTFYWTAVDIFVWGILTGYLTRVNENKLSLFTIILGTIILSNLLVRIQHGISVSAMEDVWTRNFVNLFAAPLSIKQYVAGLTMTSIFMASLALGFMALLASLLFAYNVFQFGFMLIPFLGVLFLFGLALGMFSIVLILRFGPPAETLIWTIPASLAPFSGVFYPIAALPAVIQWIPNILPSSYVFEGMRAVILTGTFDPQKLLIAAGISLLYLVIAYLLLVRSYRLALNRGLFVRFLAESF